MDMTTKRNEAHRIESALLNKIALVGTTRTAEAIGVDKAQISRWKRDWIPKLSMLLAVLEWGVVDDDVARISKNVALHLERIILKSARNGKAPARTEANQLSMEF